MHFKYWLLTESVQDIINLKYPPIIASIIQRKFGNLAYLIARWLRESYTYSSEAPDNWWLQAMANFREMPSSLYDLTSLYGATSSVDAYKAEAKRLELSVDEDIIDDYYLKNQREALEKQIENRLFDKGFFHKKFIKAIMDGEIKDLAPYKKLTYHQAEDKFDKKDIFKDRKPLKVYQNGYKWIDVGMRNHYIGKLMKHCGSSCLMSLDTDNSMIVLFDSRNKPHVNLTYSPNEKRLSGDVGVASSEVKAKYHDYIMDLAHMLNAKFDTEKTKSKALKIKYSLKDKLEHIEPVKNISSTLDEYFLLRYDGKEYYSNAYDLVSKEDMAKVKELMKSEDLPVKHNNPIQSAFNYRNKEILARLGIKYIPLYSLNQITQI